MQIFHDHSKASWLRSTCFYSFTQTPLLTQSRQAQSSSRGYCLWVTPGMTTILGHTPPVSTLFLILHLWQYVESWESWEVENKMQSCEGLLSNVAYNMINIECVCIKRSRFEETVSVCSCKPNHVFVWETDIRVRAAVKDLLLEAYNPAVSRPFWSTCATNSLNSPLQRCRSGHWSFCARCCWSIGLTLTDKNVFAKAFRLPLCIYSGKMRCSS